MAIVQTLNKYSLIDIVKAHGRLDQFGYAGWQKLFDYMENMSEEMGEPIELDVVAWCCEYTMCESAQEVFDSYDTGIHPEEWNNMDDKEKLEAIEKYLTDTSVVCCEDDCIIFANF